MPRDDLVIAGRHVGELERTLPVRDGIVRMPNHEQVSVHPYVTGVSFQFDDGVARQRDPDVRILKWKGNVVRRRAAHPQCVWCGRRIGPRCVAKLPLPGYMFSFFRTTVRAAISCSACLRGVIAMHRNSAIQ